MEKTTQSKPEENVCTFFESEMEKCNVENTSDVSVLDDLIRTTSDGIIRYEEIKKCASQLQSEEAKEALMLSVVKLNCAASTYLIGLRLNFIIPDFQATWKLDDLLSVIDKYQTEEKIRHEELIKTVSEKGCEYCGFPKKSLPSDEQEKIEICSHCDKKYTFLKKMSNR